MTVPLHEFIACTQGAATLTEDFDEAFKKMCNIFRFGGSAGDSTSVQSFEFTFDKYPKSPSSLVIEMAITLTSHSVEKMERIQPHTLISH